ncbi:hypothetical protein VTK73DRAFT_35 [Phialemonium thermophilum]|uniref:Uncharacterized protein n=1 Tax=Phialemonium thermophilum TaxID=223376 RepID=A0ABR3Y7Q1_9PEZI
MELRMEGAARRADRVAQRSLPHRPHHLCTDAKRRYPTPPGFWFMDDSARLQYMTYLSDADRGVLVTLPFFEIRDEPEEMAKPTPPVARGEVKKKMSFKDYQNRKKSTSPTEVESTLNKAERQQAGRLPPPDHQQNGKPDEAGKAGVGATAVSRVEKVQAISNGERFKDKSPGGYLAVDPPRSESRKRNLSDERASSPTKKPKREDVGSAKSQSSRVSRPSSPESGNIVPVTDADRDKTTIPSRPVNGHPQSDRDRDRDRPSQMSSVHMERNPSQSESSTRTPPRFPPSARSATNRLRSPLPLAPQHDGRKSITGTSPSGRLQSAPRHSRNVSTSKIPALVSPLRLNLDEDDDDDEEDGKTPPVKRSEIKKKPAKVTTQQRAASIPKASTLIPPLLSPTLPPLVEAELARLKKTPSKTESSGGSSRASESPSSSKKVKAPVEEEKNRRSLIVVLKYKKKNARRVSAILALPSKSHKEALKKERSASAERITPPAKKRPLPADDQTGVDPPGKRSRVTASTPSTRAVQPSTPLKNTTTAMARVASNTSQARTPGDSTGLTPGASERPPTSSGSVDHANSAKVATLRQRHDEYTGLGGKLKHAKDALIRDRGGQSGLSPADENRAAALHFEMILAYMIAFSALNQARTLDHKIAELRGWQTLIPHFPEVKMRLRSHPALFALAVQMNAVCLEEITRAYTTFDPSAAAAFFPNWAKHEKRRRPTWGEAAALLDEVTDEKMKVRIGPWMAADDAVASALAIMRRWAEREKVDWRPVIVAPS